MKIGEFYKDKADRMIYEIVYVSDKNILVNENYPTGDSEVRMLSRIGFECDVEKGELVRVKDA